MLKGLYILDALNFELIYGSAKGQIGEYVEIIAEPQTMHSIALNPSLLSEVDVIFSGWGCPMLDESFLNQAPRLKAVFYGSGSIKSFVTEAFWERDIQISSAYAGNAVPVSEFTLSQILFSLKLGWQFVSDTKKENRIAREAVPGVFGSVVGLISLGMVGRKVRDLLKLFNVKVIAYDPFVSLEEAERLQVELCSLEQVFQRADVVTLHAPMLKETEGLITGAHFASMKPNATFINTSRGIIVRENEMIEVLKHRKDLFAILDVTFPEPPVDGSPLLDMDNVKLTPHIAGPMTNECLRMGEYMFDELKRFVNGEPLKWGITKEKALTMA